MIWCCPLLPLRGEGRKDKDRDKTEDGDGMGRIDDYRPCCPMILCRFAVPEVRGKTEGGAPCGLVQHVLLAFKRHRRPIIPSFLPILLSFQVIQEARGQNLIISKVI